MCGCFLLVLGVLIIVLLKRLKASKGPMIRRVLNALVENQPFETTYTNPFSKKETSVFGWLSSIAPCFPLNAKNIKIINEPSTFYETLKTGCSQAQERIVLVSLYFGTETFEQKLVEAVQQNEQFKNGKLQIKILLDYMRGSRDKKNSRTILQPLLTGACSEISLYHTPCLRGVLKKLVPNRVNEIYGLQHMKLYIFDDTVIMSGANLSIDYFRNRQDRYIAIKDRRLSDFYCGLVNQVQKFSLKLDRFNNTSLHEEWPYLPYDGDKDAFIEKACDLVESYIVNTKEEQNSYTVEGCDTWIYPLLQMGQFGICQDSLATTRLLAEAPSQSTLRIATGYFNLTSEYMTTLIKKTKANCDILMAHPRTNGFFGAKGLSGGIPYVYSRFASNFQVKLEKSSQQDRIKLFEYLRDQWTYHGKGLWYYSPGQKTPCLTLIGSSNFGHRSVSKDIEMQIVLVTENETLRDDLHEECEKLYKFGYRAETDRETPNWVEAFVILFKNYF